MQDLLSGALLVAAVLAGALALIVIGRWLIIGGEWTGGYRHSCGYTGRKKPSVCRKCGAIAPAYQYVAIRATLFGWKWK